MLLTNYKHTQPTLGLSVTFVFNIEYIYIYIYTHTHTQIESESCIYQNKIYNGSYRHSEFDVLWLKLKVCLSYILRVT